MRLVAQSSTGASSSFFSAWVSVESLTFREVGGSKETLAATNWGCCFCNVVLLLFTILGSQIFLHYEKQFCMRLLVLFL